ncbi:MAG: hypothetical protein PVH85_25500 [Desulfobacterales bacterium]|jgi:hypothetical protein
MKHDLKQKVYIGFRGFMMRIPPVLLEKGAKSGEKGPRRMQTSIFGFDEI